MNNIFLELGEGMPPENWFSNSLCFLLNSQKRLCRYVVECLTEYRDLPGSVDSVTATTQERLIHSDRIIDVRISDTKGKFLLLIENKIGAPLDLAQIQDEFQDVVAADTGRKAAYLVVLTHRDERDNIDPKLLSHPSFRYLRWSRLHSILAEYKTANTMTNLYIRMFLRYLEESGLAPPKPFVSSTNYGTSWKKFVSFKNTSNHILEAIVPDLCRQSPGYWSQRGDEEEDEDEPYLGYHLFPSKLRRSRNRNRLQVWAGFLADHGKVYADVEVLFYPTRDFLQKVLLSNCRPKYEKWYARMKGLGWKYYWSDAETNDEDKDRIMKYKLLSDFIGRKKDLEWQKKAIQEFFTECVDNVDKVGTHELLAHALAYIH